MFRLTCTPVEPLRQATFGKPGADAAKAPRKVPSRERVGRRIPSTALRNQLAGTGSEITTTSCFPGLFQSGTALCFAPTAHQRRLKSKVPGRGDIFAVRQSRCMNARQEHPCPRIVRTCSDLPPPTSRQEGLTGLSVHRPKPTGRSLRGRSRHIVGCEPCTSPGRAGSGAG